MPSRLPLERAERLGVEEERLRALPSFKFELLEFHHDGHARGVVVDEAQRHPIRIEFGAPFPFDRPTLWSDSDDIKALRHVNRAGEICTLRSQPDDWEPERHTAAELVERAWKLIVNRGDLDVYEDDAIPEPADFRIDRYTPLLLAPEDAQAGACAYGAATILTVPAGIERVLLSDFRNPAGDLQWSLSEARVRQYSSSPNPTEERVPWFHAAEPPPYSLDSVEDLERVMPTGLDFHTLLALTRVRASVPRKTKQPVRFLIHFEDETGSRWAFVEIPMLRNRGGNLKPVGTPTYLRSFTIGNDSFFGRIDGLLDRERLQGSHVVLIGLGAIGSHVASLLNQSSVGRITAFDGDIVEPGNPVRGQLPFAHIGLAKVTSVGVTLREHLPTNQFHGVPSSTLHPNGQEELERVLSEEGVDLCVVAIGHHNHSRRLDQVLARYDIPRIYTWTTRGAAAGVVLAVHPQADGAALVSYDDYHQRDKDHEFPDLPEDPEMRVPSVVERGCAAPALPATPLDITTVALHASQTALDALLDKRVAPYQYWTRQERAWHSVTLDEPIPLLRQPWKGGGASVSEVLVSSLASGAIRRHVDDSREYETGGVLAGSVEGSTLQIEFASGPGERSQRGRTWLVLEQQYAQGCIDAVASMSNGRLRYTGEWHTHPSGDLIPSEVDRRSLYALAASSEAGIDIPIILVVGQEEEAGLRFRAFTQDADSLYEVRVVQERAPRGSAGRRASAPRP